MKPVRRASRALLRSSCVVVGASAVALLLTSGSSATVARTLHGSISVSKSGSGSGVVIGRPPVGDGIETQLNCGSQCSTNAVDPSDPLYVPFTMTATADSGSVFKGWSGACSGTGRTCTIDPVVRLASYSAVARFDRVLAAQYPVVVALQGSGSVTSAPAGIDCGATCAANFKTLTDVTLTATPSPGWSFRGWQGDCSGTATCVMRIEGPKSVTAVFDPPTSPLAVAVAGDGSVSTVPAGIDCGSACLGRFPTGSTVRLVAAPAPGATFVGWGGGCTGTGLECDVNLATSTAVTATFTGTTNRPLAVAVVGEGTVVGTPGAIDCGSSCSATFAAGARVTLRASAGPTARFVRWSGGCTGSTASCTVTMSAARAVVAVFADAASTQLLAVSTSGKGSVASAPPGIECGTVCTAALENGAEVVLTASPAPRFTFVGWSGACSGTAPCRLTMDGPRSVAAQFAPAADQVAPTLRALPSSGRAGSVVRLRYRVADASGRGRAWADVFAGARRVGSARRPLVKLDDDALYYFLPWKAPSSLAGRSLRFCVWAADPSGNVSPRRCSTVRLAGRANTGAG